MRARAQASPAPMAIMALLLATATTQVSAGLPPVADCASLAEAKLGPNVTVLSAAMAPAILETRLTFQDIPCPMGSGKIVPPGAPP